MATSPARAPSPQIQASLLTRAASRALARASVELRGVAESICVDTREAVARSHRIRLLWATGETR